MGQTSGGAANRRVLLLAGAAGAPLAAACGPAAGPAASERGAATKTAERAAITFMNRGGREAFAVHDKVIAAFTAQTPRITVTAEPVVEGSRSAKLTTLLASDTAPHTVMCAFGDFLPFCKRGDLVGLDRFLSQDREVRPGDWYPLALESMRYKGRIFNLPYNGGTYALFYNKHSGNGIVRATKQPDASWELLKFFGGAPGQRILGVEGLTLPAVRQVAESDEILKSTPPDNQRAFLTEIDRARIRFNWNITEQREWDELLSPELNRVWSGEAKAKDVLPPLVPRLNEVLARSWDRVTRRQPQAPRSEVERGAAGGFRRGFGSAPDSPYRRRPAGP